jgi:hypothetical protein
VRCAAVCRAYERQPNKVAFVPRFFDRTVQKLVLLASSALAQKAAANSATLQLIGVLIFCDAPNSL